MLTYCVPLIPTAVFWWIMGVSDRYLVKWFVGSDANGIYAVAYKIPTILTILATVFMDAWQLSAIAESGDRRAQARFYARVGRVLLRGLPLRGRHHRVFAAAHPPACSGELSCDCIHTADKISNFILLNAPCISFTMSFAVVK